MIYVGLGSRMEREFNGYCTAVCHRCNKPSVFGLVFESGRGKVYGVQSFSHSEKQLAICARCGSESRVRPEAIETVRAYLIDQAQAQLYLDELKAGREPELPVPAVTPFLLDAAALKNLDPEARAALDAERKAERDRELERARNAAPGPFAG